MRPHRSGARMSAGTKPTQRESCQEKYAPSMNRLACAKLSTPIRLKMSVRPEDNMNNRSPYTAPFRSEKVTSSTAALGPLHLAGRRQRRLVGVDLRVVDEAQAAALDVVLRLVRQRGNEERLEQLVVVGVHLHRPQRRVHLDALEGARELHGVVRARLLRRRLEQREHVAQPPVVELVRLVGEALVERDLVGKERRQHVLVVLGNLLEVADAVLADGGHRTQAAAVI